MDNSNANGGSRALTTPASEPSTASTTATSAPPQPTPPIPHADPATGRIPVILDCDPGHDDAFAILLAALHPRLQLLGVTTTAGNQTLHKTTTNALNVLHIAAATNIPVVAGRHEPLMRPAVVAEAIHGVTGLDGAEVPGSTQQVSDERVADFIFRTAKQYLSDHHTLPPLPTSSLTHPPTHPTSQYSNPDGITLIAVGPLTNIALTLLAYPDIKLLIRQVVLMGGAIGLGNVTPAAEFNIYADPEAASIVFNSGLSVTMVPLEVTHTALCTTSVMSSIRALASPFSRLLEQLLLFFAHTYTTMYGFEAPPLHDPCAVAYVIDPSLFDSQLMHVSVDCSSGGHAGRTVCDVYGVLTDRVKNVRVCQRINVDKFWVMMLDAIAVADKRSPMNKT